MRHIHASTPLANLTGGEQEELNMLSIAVFALMMGLAWKVSSWVAPGGWRTLLLSLLFAVFTPVAVFAALALSFHLVAETASMNANESVGRALVNAVLALIGAPLFVWYFRMRRRRPDGAAARK